MNIATNLDRSALYFPDRPALMDGYHVIPFSEFHRDAGQMASALSGMGVGPGDHVALYAPNSYEWLVFYFGALKAGAVAVTFSHLLSQEELAVVLSDCLPAVLFMDDEKLKRMEPYRNGGSVPYVVSNLGDISFSRLIERGSPDFVTLDRDRHDVAAVLYTGGTTGTPKGAMLTHQNLLASTFNVAYHERSTPKDRALCFLPLNHVFAQVHIMHSTVFSGGGLVIQNGFDLEKALDAIDRHQVTKFYAVPTLYIRLLELPDISEKMKPVRYCFSAAASMATAVVKEWKKQTDLAIHEAYGMTESASMVTFNHYHRHVIGSVGTPANLVEVEIRDLDGNPLPQGERGEICIQGPNICKGYLNNPEETAAALKDGWFCSGDVGVMDENGYLFIVDRLKDMIITGGENVYAREVEEVLCDRPEVSECAVIGLPDTEYGERVVAVIVPRKDCRIDPAALKDYMKTRLARFKVPKEYILVKDLPKNNAGKLLKRQLKKHLS